MINKKWLTIFVIATALVFLSTSVYAKSRSSYSNRYTKSWWYRPYKQLKQTIKEVNMLQNKISKLKSKTIRLENRKNNLEEQINMLEAEIDSLQERKTKLSNADYPGNNGENGNKPGFMICAGCNFADSNEFIGYDFSEAFLGHMNAYFADFSHANFTKAKMRQSIIYSSNFQNVNFTKTDLVNATLAADFTGACFKEAKLDGVTWVSDWYGAAICPNGTQLVNVGDSCMGQLDLEIHCQ